MQKTETIIPPLFEPIAYLIYDDNYISQLEELISKVPVNFIENDEWWHQLKLVTKVKPQIINKIRNEYIELRQEKKKDTAEALEKVSETPIAKKTKTEELLKLLADNIQKDKADLETILKIKLELQEKFLNLEKLIKTHNEQIKKYKQTNEHLQINGNIITEAIEDKLITKIRQFLASDTFKNLINSDPNGSEINKTLARLVIRDVLLMVKEHCYTILNAKGITAKNLFEAWTARETKEGMEILKKAKNILKPQTTTSPKTITPPEPKPPKIIKPPQTHQSPPKSNVEIIVSRLISIGEKAKMQGMDRNQAIENELKRLEEKNIPDIGIVRRHWEEFKNIKKR